MEVLNLKQIGTWEIKAQSFNEYKAVVYECTLEAALRAGCAIINQYFSPRTYTVAEIQPGEFRCTKDDDPWCVDCKKTL